MIYKERMQKWGRHNRVLKGLHFKNNGNYRSSKPKDSQERMGQIQNTRWEDIVFLS